ncbi:hypothetical protein [Hoyosella altamirensis]|uniref:ABC-type transporter Mla subunit MlaD n=1 Tax=Hoyosella altamirensis TaxID=616997 RepID=A0A839RQ61_9ACTN|nr:hypothetical protein [Hoyosella altamirensis]MBB3038186.1 ABC-type transporter Mla subunit MlaD [Hoyosella altamirensis]
MARFLPQALSDALSRPSRTIREFQDVREEVDATLGEVKHTMGDVAQTLAEVDKLMTDVGRTLQNVDTTLTGIGRTLSSVLGNVDTTLTESSATLSDVKKLLSRLDEEREVLRKVPELTAKFGELDAIAKEVREIHSAVLNQQQNQEDGC